MAKGCTKMKNARAGRLKPLFFFPAEEIFVFCRFRSRRCIRIYMYPYKSGTKRRPVQLENFQNTTVGCRTGGLARPARYTSTRAKRKNERDARCEKNLSRFALVYRAGPAGRANPPVLQATPRLTINHEVHDQIGKLHDGVL